MQAPEIKKGFIKLPRWIMQTDIYNDGGPFTRYQAYEYLILNASFKRNPIWRKGCFFELKKGQLVVSHRELAKAFNWGRDKVRRFLDGAVKMQLIETENTQNGTVITVLNYQYFQGFAGETVPPTVPPTVPRVEPQIEPPTVPRIEPQIEPLYKNIKNNKEVEEGASATTSEFSLNAITTWRKFRRGYQPSTRDKEHLDILQDIIQDRIKATQGKTYSEEQLIEVWETVLEHLPEHKKGKDLWMIIEDFDEIANQVSYSLEKEYQ